MSAREIKEKKEMGLLRAKHFMYFTLIFTNQLWVIGSYSHLTKEKIELRKVMWFVFPIVTCRYSMFFVFKMVLLYFSMFGLFEPSAIHFIIKYDSKIILLHGAVHLYKQHLPKSNTFCQPHLASDLTIEWAVLLPFYCNKSYSSCIG